MTQLFNVRAVGMTKPLVLDLETTEDLIVYQARVSAPKNQQKMLSGGATVPTTKFIESCKARDEWSVFQMANINLEISGPRDILRQFTRHESMGVVEDDGELLFVPDGMNKHAGGVQEFSQRYAAVQAFVQREGRMAHYTDRQSSIDDEEVNWRATAANMEVIDFVRSAYEERLRNGEAKETARVILPEGLVTSHLCVNATVRSWMHFLDVREKHATQKEHRQLAAQIRDVLHGVMPLLF